MSQWIKLIGVGSPYGNDDIGWKIIAACRQAPVLQTHFSNQTLTADSLDRPGLSLLHHFNHTHCLFLFDAVSGHDAPLKIVRCEDIAVYSQRGLLSTHGFGIAEAVRLAEVLGQLPPKLIFYGISIEPDQMMDVSNLSPVINRVKQQVIAEIVAMLAGAQHRVGEL